MSVTPDPAPDSPRRRKQELKPVYLNRELSWLAFNERVLEEAADASNPLLERLRFLTIFHNNLDEFFMIRVAGLKEQVASGVDVVSPDGMSPRAQLQRLHQVLDPVLARADAILNELLPLLDDAGVSIVHYRDLEPDERAKWDRWYERKVYPVLTPLAVGPSHPFPFISNLALNLGLLVRSADGESRFARIKVPAMLPQLVPLDDDNGLKLPCRLMPLEELIAANLHNLFLGVDAGEAWAFRVTRDTDIEIQEDEAGDLLKLVEQEVRNRRFGDAVRLEVQRGMPPAIREQLRKGLDLEAIDVYEASSLLDLRRMSKLLAADLPEHKFPPFTPRAGVRKGTSLFKQIRNGDVLLHHPFDSFGTVTDFLHEAATDPEVLAIKMTLYRTSGDGAIIQALEKAIENEKQVAVVVELKARFDEENNITWARRLEEAGVHVVYGIPNLKVHSKLTLVVRREGNELRRYAHLGTGNYNTATSRVYTDFGLLTANPLITADVADVFNQLTGFAHPPRSRKLLVAPRHMANQITERIQRETAEAKAGRPARMILKCNAITDEDVIKELYVASNAGVQIDMIVRGVCCLVPGRPGLSENITVRSIVGRFLEHSRVFWFYNAGDSEVLMGSADLMNRNLRRRVEVMVPIEEPERKRWVFETFLKRYLEDTERTRVMNPDGTFTRLRDRAPADKPRRDAHLEFLRDRK